MQSGLTGSNPEFQLYRQQVSGKAPKLVTSDSQMILKCYIEEEKQFYNYFAATHNSSPHYSLKAFLPRYFGVVNLASKPKIDYKTEGENKQLSVWLQHIKMRYETKNQGNKFILLENFLLGYHNPNVLDIKIGGKQDKAKKSAKSQHYLIKLNGMLKTASDCSAEFISKYHLNSVEGYHESAKYIAYFFTTSGKLQLPMLNTVLGQLQSLVLAIRSSTDWRLWSTSMCIIYDSDSPAKVRLRYIDFGRARKYEMAQQYDQQTSSGVEYVISIVGDIIKQPHKYENVIVDKKENEDVVPLCKIKKFSANEKELPDCAPPQCNHQLHTNSR